MRQFGMPARDELQKAGFDADAYVKYDEGWYDGSIRAMDVEMLNSMALRRDDGNSCA